MSRPPKILLSDHRGQGLARLAAALGHGAAEVLVSNSVRESLARLQGEPVDLVVLDPLVEGGAQERAEIARRRAAPDTSLPLPAADPRAAAPQGGGALLLVCAPEAQGAALAALRQDPSPLFDVVRRDAPVDEFVLRAERLLAAAREHVARLELEHRASHDDRTDLLRPDAFERRLFEHVSASQRHHFELALAILDLDGFGRVNKTWDHTVGDLVIAKVGEAIRRNLRQEDVAGRLGGDEFAVLLPYTKKIEAAYAVRRLRDEIAKLTPLLQARVPGLKVGASIGFETCDGHDIDSVETLRLHTEIALREAKRLGGGQAVYFRSLAPRPEST